MENNFVEKVEAVMDGWRGMIQVAERTLIDNVAATVPWLAPVAPAYMAWHGCVTVLKWEPWVAWVVALAIEGLGLSVVNTAYQMWQRERLSRREDHAARNDITTAIGMLVFYLIIVITVNVGLELGWYAWIAKALLSLLSVPAAVTIALRSGMSKENHEDELVEMEELAHRRQVEAEEQARRSQLEADELAYRRQVENEERERRHALKMARIQLKVAETGAKVEKEIESGAQKYGNWRAVPASERAKIASMGLAEVMAEYGLKERTAYHWMQNAKRLEKG